MTEGGAASVGLPVVWHADQRDVVTLKLVSRDACKALTRSDGTVPNDFTLYEGCWKQVLKVNRGLFAECLFNSGRGVVADEEIVLSTRILAGSRILESDRHGIFHSYYQNLDIARFENSIVLGKILLVYLPVG